MQRRPLLKYLAGSLAATCLICVSSWAPASGTKAHWGYSGKDGPGHWGDLDPAYGTCSQGVQQSPIDLVAATSSALSDIAVHYPEIPLKIVNNGHTI
jgi:carbonic anhydrase